MGQNRDLTGAKFGRLTVLARSSDQNRRTHWLCACACGNKKAIAQDNLVSEKTSSCGCFQKESAAQIGKRNRIHGGDQLPVPLRKLTYNSWRAMIDRCENPANIRYFRYGAKGIKVCDRWRNSFDLFCNDMGGRPSKEHSIDRIDGDRGYDPENCRWATRREQTDNRKGVGSHVVFYNGETKSISEWARYMGLTANALFLRINQLGWPIEKALTTPLKKRSLKKQSA
jgi:hypothetical protein